MSHEHGSVYPTLATGARQSPPGAGDNDGQAVHATPPVSGTDQGDGSPSVPPTSNPWAGWPNPGPPQAPPNQAAIDNIETCVRQLEEQNEGYWQKIQNLQRQIGEIGISPVVLQAAPSAVLKRPADQSQRTAIRIKLLEKLNHHGNRCCAWHETRQELHEYSAREAPTGIMNCGCTFEEALFEESLSKSGVGSMVTGAKRLNPALRNALLLVFQRAYGYTDGDLAFNRVSSEWLDGESPAYWSEKENFYEL